MVTDRNAFDETQDPGKPYRDHTAIVVSDDRKDRIRRMEALRVATNNTSASVPDCDVCDPVTDWLTRTRRPSPNPSAGCTAV